MRLFLKRYPYHFNVHSEPYSQMGEPAEAVKVVCEGLYKDGATEMGFDKTNIVPQRMIETFGSENIVKRQKLDTAFQVVKEMLSRNV